MIAAKTPAREADTPRVMLFQNEVHLMQSKRGKVFNYLRFAYRLLAKLNKQLLMTAEAIVYIIYQN